jgi:uncharacterized membrane protein
MSYREKLAWVSFIAMLIAYAVYFGITGPSVDFGERRMLDILWTFGPSAAAHGIAIIIGAIVIAVLSHKDARAPADERDRAITRRASTIAYYVLIAGFLLVGMVMPFTEPPWKIVNAALLAIVLAELINQAIVLISYRRGWHG